MSATTASELGVTPAALIASVRAARAAADAAEVAVLGLAVEWAHAHPEVPGDASWHAGRGGAFDDGSPDVVESEGDEVEWFGIPGVRWDAPAAFAAADRMSTSSGRALIRDALVLRHRLPRVHERVLAGVVAVWQARRVAQAVLGEPVDVVAQVDAEVSRLLDASGRVGPVVLSRVVDEAMLRLYPEEREAAQLAELDARHTTLHPEINDAGIGEMTLRGLWPDLRDFDDAVAAVAAALGRDAVAQGELVESLDVRRSMAVGVLADPAAAVALLADDPAWADRLSRREARVVVHVSDGALLGLDPVARVGTGAGVGVGTAVLDQAVRVWCGRPGSRITVRPVIDLNVEVARESYRPSAAQVEQVVLRDRTCVFPWCTRPSEGCDVDHVVAYDHDDPRAGPTDTANLAALCRHHHRLKTHTGWSYTVIEAGVYLWADPHGQRLLRTRDGTRDVTPATGDG